jgi:hypothetical protein
MMKQVQLLQAKTVYLIYGLTTNVGLTTVRGLFFYKTVIGVRKVGADTGLFKRAQILASFSYPHTTGHTALGRCLPWFSGSAELRSGVR